MDLAPLLAPASIAAIGASRRAGAIGHELIAAILKSGYGGELYPVNPRYSSIEGLACYPAIGDIGQPVDLAFLILSASRLEQQVDMAIAAGAKAMVITPNAIYEGDSEPPLKDRLKRKLMDADIPVSGYNSMGFYNIDLNLRACGFRAPYDQGAGHIAFISQSGSVFSAITHNDPQLRFNLSINTGTELNVTVADYMLYALEQPTTRVIGIFLESVRDPENFRHALHQAASRKIPVVILKVGASELGARFTISHSGGLAGDDDALEAVLRHYGAIRAASMDELANLLMLFSYHPSPPDGDIALIADSGGERSMIADEADRVGLEFSDLSEETMARLAAIQEYGQEAANPLDPWGTGLNFKEVLSDSLKMMVNDPSSAAGILSLDLRDDNFMVAGCLDAMKDAADGTSKPLLHMTNYSGVRRARTTAKLNKLGVPVLCGTRPALGAVQKWLRFRDYRYSACETRSGSPLNGHAGVIQEFDALNVLRQLGIPAIQCHPVSCLADVERAAASQPFPAVLKTMRPGVAHKSDVNGVIANIQSGEELVAAYRRMAQELGELALIQSMLKFDLELILGMKSDDTFGPLVIMGTGGAYAEHLRDSVALLPTAGEAEILERLQSLAIYPLLLGVRGRPRSDIGALVETVSNFCSIVRGWGTSVSEADINPLAIHQGLPIALDALIVPNNDGGFSRAHLA